MEEQKLRRERLCRAALVKMAAGDNEALADIYCLLGRHIYLLSYSVLRDRHLAEDASQETLVRVREKCGGYAGKNAVNWVMTVCRNISLDMLRRRSFESPDALLTDVGIASERTDARDVGEEATDAVFAERALAVLGDDETDRMTVTLRIVSGFSYAEIARTLGISEGNARVRYSRALEKIRNTLCADAKNGKEER